MSNRFSYFDSLAWRLSASFAALSLAMGLLFASLVYASLISSLATETDGYLEDTVNQLIAVLKKCEDENTSIKASLNEELSPRRYMRTYARILNQKGVIVFESEGTPKKLVPALFPEPIAWHPDPVGVDVTMAPGGRIYRTISVKLDSPEDCVLQLACDRRREAAIMRRFRNFLFGALGGSMLLSAGGVYWIARRGIRPVVQITQATEQIGQTTLHERLELKGLPSELRQLESSFNAMLDRLEESFGRLSQFSEDIAHELRTPVNNLRGGMEVILGKRRSPEEYRDALGSALEECERLARLVDRLLFIARSENSAAKIERETISVRDELLNTCEFYEVNADESGVKLAVDAKKDLFILANCDLLRSMLGNLVSNAIAHTPRGGSVKLAAQRLTDGVEISVTDTGTGIPAEHLPHIFDRFYRVDRSRTKTSGGVGLGLAIVNTIAKLHGAQISVESELKKGTSIKVKFVDGE